METFSSFQAFCVGNSPAQRPVTRSFDVFIELHLNQQLSNIGDTGYLRHHRTHYDVIV